MALKAVVALCNICFCQIAMHSFIFSPLQSFYLVLELSGTAALGLEAQTTQKFSF